TAPIDPAALGGLLPGRPAVFEESERYTYFRRTHDGRLVFGGRALSDGTDGPEGVVRFLQSLIPQASRVDVPFYWTGPLGITGMGLPFWGETGGGTVYAGGYSGHGGALSVHLGLQLGRYLATGREPAWPRIPPVPFGFSDRIARDFKRPSAHPKRFAILR
ncbi:MAG: FAD-dependent oxidoreductase, partial [Clostridia bacterium]